MIDARNTFRQINTTLRDFSPDQMAGLHTIIQSYRGEDVGSAFTTNPWLQSTFENGRYEDIEGLCKIVTIDEVETNDWSLTPGRYVGYSIDVDKDFDYKTRLTEIHDGLNKLNIEAGELMQRILNG
jgi:type I restriction enzyme M protein